MDMNIDVKDLFAKLKKGGSGTKKAEKGGNPFVRFFEKNPKLKVILPAFLILIALVVAILLSVSATKVKVDDIGTGTSKPSGTPVQVLPELERPKTDDPQDGANPFDEDAIANAKLKGIMYNSNGYYTAIVETQTHSFILQAGDYVPESDWLVEKITSDMVTFSMGDKVRTVELKG